MVVKSNILDDYWEWDYGEIEDSKGGEGFHYDDGEEEDSDDGVEVVDGEEDVDGGEDVDGEEDSNWKDDNVLETDELQSSRMEDICRQCEPSEWVENYLATNEGFVKARDNLK